MKSNAVRKLTFQQEIDLLWACYDEAMEEGQSEMAQQWAEIAFEKLTQLPENAIYVQVQQ